MKKKNVIIISLLIIALIIGAITCLKSGKISELIGKENKVEESKTENTELTKKKKVLEDYLFMYSLRDCFQIPLYEKLNLHDGYNNYEEYNEKEFSLYEDVTIINREMYNHYGTNIKYESFKKAMLNYISEGIFEQEFTIYQKNNNGILDIYANGRDGSNYEIIKMSKITENTYDIEYKFYMGENEGIPGKMTVVFEKKDNNYIVKNCLRKTLENIKYMDVTIEDELSGQAMYKEPVKIENRKVHNELEEIINSGIEHQFNGAFGLDILPIANFYLENGDKVTVSAVDNFEMQGEESGNYIFVTINDDSNNKKIYKVIEKVQEYFTNLYDERLLTD